MRLTHTSSVTGGGLKITSSSGYVDVETVRFTADEIGIAGDTDIIQLGASSVTIRRALTVSQDTTVTGELKVMDDVIVGPSGSPNLRIYANDGNVVTKGDIELEATAAAITHSGATDATTGADYREHQRIRGRRGCALHGRQDWRQHQGGRDDAV